METNETHPLLQKPLLRVKDWTTWKRLWDEATHVHQLEELARPPVHQRLTPALLRVTRVEQRTDAEVATRFDHVTQDVRARAQAGGQVSRLLRLQPGTASLPEKSENGVGIHGPNLAGTVEVRAEQVHHALTQVGELLAASIGEGQNGNGGPGSG